MPAEWPAAWWGLFKQVASSWLDDYVPSMGAALAYYTMFSLAPLLLIVVSVAGLVFGEDAARGEIQAQLQDLMGEQGAGAVQGLLASVHRILGATIVARHAGEMINEIKLAIVAGIGLRPLARVIHAYPTQAEAIQKPADA